MEDLPYLSEDYEVQPPFTSRLQRLEQHIAKLEDYLRCGIYDQEYQDELLELVRDDIGAEEGVRKCSLRAMGYLLDMNDTLIPTLEVIDVEEAFRHDVEIRRVGDDERVLIHYEVYHPEGGLAAYYVPPLAVISNAHHLETSEIVHANHHVLQLMNANADKAQETIFVSKFFAASIKEQESILAAVADDLHDVLEVEYGADVPVSIGTQGYYQVPQDSDIQCIDWREYYHPAILSGEGPFRMLDGVIVNVVYLEALGGLRKKIENTNDLALGHGFPCIILADQLNGAVYYIPVVGVVSFHSEYDNV